MDISGFTREELTNELTKKFGDGFTDFLSDTDSEQFYENISLYDEEIMKEFLENGKVSTHSVAYAVKQRHIFPCCFGSALKLDGIDVLLNILDNYTEQPDYTNEFSAKVFKISEDEQKNRLTHLKITGGNLKVKDVIRYNSGDNEYEEKVNQIRIYSGNKYTAAEAVSPGTICAVTGLSDAFSGMNL